MEFPHWYLTDEEINEATAKGFQYAITGNQFMLTRKKDEARIWPHIDGLISCFIRQGTYTKHKKFLDLPRALDRRFSD